MRKTPKALFVLAAASLLGLSACGNKSADSGDPKAPAAGCYTFMDYTTVSPSNWNELTYQDANDTQIMSQISGSFFTFNYEFDAKGRIVKDGYTVEYDGATALEDISGEMVYFVDAGEYLDNPAYAGYPYPLGKYNVPATKDTDGDGEDDAYTENGDGYAYRITLRDDLKWDDGTPIKAQDFVYSMKEQLNPLFLNYRADSFYAGETVIANAQGYLKQGQEGMFASYNVYKASEYTEALDENLVFQSYTNSPIEGLKENSTLIKDLVIDYIIDSYPSYEDLFKKTYVNSEGETVDGWGVFLCLKLFGCAGSLDDATLKAASKALDGKPLRKLRLMQH